MCLRVLAGLLVISGAIAEGLDADRLAVVYNLDDSSSVAIARYYATRRGIPADSVIGLHVPPDTVMRPERFKRMREELLNRLPSAAQSVLLVWSKPYAVGCMSITTAVAAGYDPAFCTVDCAKTASNPLFDSGGWLPADTVGWWPAMLLPSDDVALARAVIDRGIASDRSAPPGTVYLVSTQDTARNVRAATYTDVESLLVYRIRTVRLTAPVTRYVPDAIGYFTGTAHVAEMPLIQFRPGAVADHLTSTGGVLEGGTQTSALLWLRQGATASFGAVSEPCSFPEKFPNVRVLFEHYARGETLLESYWKSVAMPGQGLFIGEPLARPYPRRGL